MKFVTTNREKISLENLIDALIQGSYEDLYYNNEEEIFYITCPCNIESWGTFTGSHFYGTHAQFYCDELNLEDLIYELVSKVKEYYRIKIAQAIDEINEKIGLLKE